MAGADDAVIKLQGITQAISSTATGLQPLQTLSSIVTGLQDIVTAIQALTPSVVNVTVLTSVAGTANVITASVSGTWSGYSSGQYFILTPVHDNTGATTIEIESSGAKNIYANGAACRGGELVTNVPVIIFYDGVEFNLIFPTSSYIFNNSCNRGYISGLTWSSGTDPNTDVIFAVGEATDDTSAVLMQLTSAIQKQFDTTFAEGTLAGGMVSGDSMPTSGTVYFWEIAKSDGTIDVCGSSSSGLAPTLPTDFVYKRLIGSRRTDGSAHFIPVTVTEIQGSALYVEYVTEISEVNGDAITSSGVTLAITTPSGIKMLAVVDVGVSNSSTTVNLSIGSTDQTLSASAPTITLATNAAGNDSFCRTEIMTDTSNQIQATVNRTSDTIYYLALRAFIDFRRV